MSLSLLPKLESIIDTLFKHAAHKHFRLIVFVNNREFFSISFVKYKIKLIKNYQKISNPICLDYILKSISLQYANKVKVSEMHFSDLLGSTLI